MSNIEFCLILALPIILYYSRNIVIFFVHLLLSFRKSSVKSDLRHQIKEFSKELSKISQTDEFAKYSKIQRKLRVTTDQLRQVNREDFELSFKYTCVGLVFIWLIAIILISRLILTILS